MDAIEDAIRHLPGDDYCSAIQQFILPRSQFSNEMFEIIGYQTIREIFGIPGSSQEYKKTKARFLRLFDKNNLHPGWSIDALGYRATNDIKPMKSACPKKTEYLWSRLRQAPEIEVDELENAVRGCCALCQKNRLLTHSIWLNTKGKPASIDEMFCANSNDHFMVNSYHENHGDTAGVKVRVSDRCRRRCLVFYYGKNYEKKILRRDVLAELRLELELPSMAQYLQSRSVEVRYTNDNVGQDTIEITPINTFRLINYLYLQLRNRGWFRAQLLRVEQSERSSVKYPRKVFRMWFDHDLDSDSSSESGSDIDSDMASDIASDIASNSASDMSDIASDIASDIDSDPDSDFDSWFESNYQNV